MRITFFAPLLAAATLALAQSDELFYNITSKPFRLVATSKDGTINTSLGACHVGAAIESFCFSASNSTSTPNPYPTVFNFNHSIYAQPPDPDRLTPGILAWVLHGGNFNQSSSAYLSYDPTTDIALPIIEPGSGSPQLFVFDKQDKLAIQGYIDYTVRPPVTGAYKQFYRWYACQTYFGSYLYINLAWKLGPGKPENPSCVAVDVTRKFVW